LRLRQSGWLGSFEEQAHSLGVVSPYRSQARDLRKILNKDSRFGGVGWKGMASVDTAHRFQGSEVDALILDLTDGPGGEYPHRGFLGAREPNEVGARLTNVAVSRARRHLILIGGLDYLGRTLPADATTNVLARLIRKNGTAIDPQDLLAAASESTLAASSPPAPLRRPQNFSRRR
jgi:superfamily I DNA and/or RNA helicase